MDSAGGSTGLYIQWIQYPSIRQTRTVSMYCTLEESFERYTLFALPLFIFSIMFARLVALAPFCLGAACSPVAPAGCALVAPLYS